MLGRKKITRKKLFKKSLIKERAEQRAKSYSIGDIVECRIFSSRRRGGENLIGVVVSKKTPKNSFSGSTYCVVTPEGTYETPYVRILKNL